MKFNRMLRFAVVVPFLASACSVVGIRTVEEAPYEVARAEGEFELRVYEPLVVVETWMDGERDDTENTAFFRLFDYIQGENEGAREIAMTAPVLQEATSGSKIAMTAPAVQESKADGWTMSFVLPREVTLDDAPLPTSADVTLRPVASKRVATVRFIGLRSEASMAEQGERLRAWIEEQGLEQVSPPRYAFYDPPFTLPFLRRNEVWIEVR